MIHIAADLHLRPCIWKGHPEISGDQYRAWAQLCNAVAEDPDGVLILAGDTFDTPCPSGETEYVFRKGMDLLRSKGRRCLFISGNHDIEGIPRPVLFGAEPLDEPRDILGMKAAGVHFTRSSTELHNTIESFPPLDILVLHTGFRHLLGFNETWQISKEDIPDSIGMVFSGHVHVHSEEGKVYSPGSLALHRADEIDKGHGWFIVNPADGSVTWREVMTRMFVSVDVDAGFSLDSLNPLVGRTGEKPVVLLNYQNSDLALADAVIDRFKESLFFVRNARAAEKAQVIEDTEATAFDPSVVATDYFTKKLSTEQRELAVEMMTANDPASVLARFIERG